jgi:hypothetical protein
MKVTTNWRWGISCILRCCALSENTVAQVFSYISTKHRKPSYLVKVIKLGTADSKLSLLWSYLKNWASNWRPKTTSSGNFKFLLSILEQRFLWFNDNLVYVSLHTLSKQELFIVNSREDIQTNNFFIMVKMDLLPHQPHTTGSSSNTHASTGNRYYLVVCKPSIYNIFHYLYRM